MPCIVYCSYLDACTCIRTCVVYQGSECV